MRKKRLLIKVILTVVIGVVLLGSALAIWRVWEEQSKEYTTLEEMAYDKSGKKTFVYIRENGEYIPYQVMESDYGGNVLLFRKNVLPEKMPYRPSPYGESTTALSGGWAWHDYGSYYEESSIDEYLNTDFPKVFSSAVQEAIVTTTIEVTDMESYHQEHWAEATHSIERKVFLLSAVELGITFGVNYNITREGKTLKYFENTEPFKLIDSAKPSIRRAYAADGTAWPYWTRTPWIKETYTVVAIGAQLEFNSVTADATIGVRPAFCLEKDTAVRKSGSVIEGKTVYILEFDDG